MKIPLSWLREFVAVRGSAQEITVRSNSKMTLMQVLFTTCPADNTTWELVAKDVNLDVNGGVGTAHGVKLEFKGVPILWAPYFTFPLNDERKKLEAERKSLKSNIDKLSGRMAAMRSDPARRKDHADEMEHLSRERAALQQLRKSINGRKLLNFFTDEGLALYDSRVICEYLNDLAKGSIFPAAAQHAGSRSPCSRWAMASSMPPSWRATKGFCGPKPCAGTTGRAASVTRSIRPSRISMPIRACCRPSPPSATSRPAARSGISTCALPISGGAIPIPRWHGGMPRSVSGPP